MVVVLISALYLEITSFLLDFNKQPLGTNSYYGRQEKGIQVNISLKKSQYGDSDGDHSNSNDSCSNLGMDTTTESDKYIDTEVNNTINRYINNQNLHMSDDIRQLAVTEYERNLEDMSSEPVKSTRKESLCVLHNNNAELGGVLENLIKKDILNQITILENKVYKNPEDQKFLEKMNSESDLVLKDYNLIIGDQQFNTINAKYRYVLEIGSLKYKYISEVYRPENYSLKHLRKYLLNTNGKFH